MALTEPQLAQVRQIVNEGMEFSFSANSQRLADVKKEVEDATDEFKRRTEGYLRRQGEINETSHNLAERDEEDHCRGVRGGPNSS